MPIPKQKYKELKAMYDFQRKVQYNKEKLRKAVEVMLEEPDILFNDIWSRMKEEEMDKIAEFIERVLKICVKIQETSGKMLKDFVAGVEKCEEIKEFVENLEDDEILKEILDFNKKIILVTGHRRENFGDGFERVFKAIKKLIEIGDQRNSKKQNLEKIIIALCDCWPSIMQF